MFLAILLKSRGIANDILVLEQNPKDATYGFGVALAEAAIDKLNEAEPSTMQALQEQMHFIEYQVFENCNGEFRVDYSLKSGAITRLDLLKVLGQRCHELDLEVSHEVRIDDLNNLDDCDLIVGADGANSVVRELHESEFGTRRQIRNNYFVWWGCEHPLNESGLRFRRYKGANVIAHYYAYTPEMWTFVGEVDRESWFYLGMDKMSNVERKAMFEEIFTDVLEGRSFIENKSDWNQFEAITNECWSAGNKVLIGDALFRAHYSIGSGTRLAMEDALGLAEALENSPHDIPGALAVFEEQGKPRKQKLMQACELSYKWYEHVHEKFEMPILEFIQDFMNRTGRMPEDRLRQYAPNLVEALGARAP